MPRVKEMLGELSLTFIGCMEKVCAPIEALLGHAGLIGKAYNPVD